MIPFWIAPKHLWHKRSVLLTSLFLFLLVISWPCKAMEEIRVCVPPFVTEGLHPKQVAFLESSFFTELNKNDQFYVIPRMEVTDTEKIMNEPDADIRKTNAYYYYLAEKLNAGLIVTVNIQKTHQEHFIVMAQKLDALTRTNLEVIILESEGSKDSFLATIATLSQRLAGAKDAQIVIPMLTRLEADIAFCSDRNGNWDIYLLASDERYPKQLTTNFATDFSPSWSPDGKNIIYSGRVNRNYELIILDLATGTEKVITNNRLEDVTPHWSAQGDLVVYCAAEERYKMFLLNLQTGEKKELTNKKRDEFFPHLSPDGKYVVYSAGEPSRLYFIDLETGETTPLLDSPGPDFNPVYSPDGTKIAFESTRDGNYEIYLMNLDGTELKNLTQNTAADMSAAFSPDGKWLAFSSDREGNNDIYVMNINGQVLANITQNPKDDRLPAWSPVRLPRQ